ncbi:MAG: ATP-dependent RecD-like DNA helicase [Eubacterium sp.]|nr:ATP-dependent RecD-like DNA helicase [Eubacterium sp.]MDD7209022.1 ATP-dependent RecD-like DNA helicase [Lachnospiraceae bacterium]MDY5497261.1 ATP-dependent RecD-like DNA helicase [Anaerobutyricum sp.]
MASLEGYVAHIRFRNEENGYTVLELETTHGDEILVGNFHYIDEGEYLCAEADYVDHPAHGPQYQMKSYIVKEPEDKEAMERYLSSGAIKGMGPALAKRVIKKFKGDTFEIIEKEPERLAEVKGISLKKAMDIAVQFQEKQEMRHAMMFLSEYGISNRFAVRIFEEYGDKMYEILKTNPYKLAEDISGIGFRAADSIAAKVGIAPDSDFRICSAILYTLMQASVSGHVYLPREILCRSAGELLSVSPAFIEDHLMDMVLDKKIMIRTVEKEERVYLTSFYFMERNTSRMLLDLDLHFPMEKGVFVKCMNELEQSMDIQMDLKQKEAVEEALTRGVVVVTGGPGTGKTTTINLMIHCFEMEDMDIVLAAPTGRAAKRMTEATGYEAKTIHRLLEVSGGIEDGNDSHFEKNEENPIEADAVILDEMSMVDIHLMYALLKAIVPGTRLILVGDSNQLPSVGPGNVLKDIIDSEAFRVVCLSKIYRQQESSRIVLNAHRINAGEQIVLDNKNKDFFFFEKKELRSVMGALIYLVKTKLPEYIGVSPFEVQVLTPMRKGELGVEHLNEVLQYYLNPASDQKAEREVRNGIFREGDKVMQIKNNYKLEWKILNEKGFSVEEGLGVFNGDMGMIRQINTYSERVTVVFDENRQVEYPFTSLDELELAYAITIHKSQGSEYPAVVIPLLNGPAILCNRNLLYTAITRAQKCVAIVGRRVMVEQMIRNEMEQRRYSGLADCLREGV